MPQVDHIWPRPRHAQILPGSFTLGRSFTVAEDALPSVAQGRLQAELARWSCALEQGTDVSLQVMTDRTLGREAYRLEILPQGLQIQAAGPSGVFYAVMTLCQWLRCHGVRPGAGIAAVRFEDEPDFPERGVMLDISRNKVPTLATLFELIDFFAVLKINQLQLYLEHSFAYQGHEQVWRASSPLTPADVTALVAYCQDRFIELVPNQNSFGHFHRWLVHEAYRPLAECPEGVEHAFSSAPEPFSLCAVDPRVLELLEDLYGQLLPLFPSRRFNIGLDETFDLGMGRSAEACAAQGKTEVYLDFLKKVHRAAAAHGRQIMFWGDIIIERPDLITSLPEDVIALEWGYEAGHPFAEHGKAFAQSGRTFYVCPGTSSWNSFAGRLDNALENLRQAALHGKANGARGYLITDWGDRGHLQPLPVSYPGLLAGAALAWNSQQPVEERALIRALAEMAPDRVRPALVRVLLALGKLYGDCGSRPTNGSALFFLYWFIDKDLRFERLAGLSSEGLEVTRHRLRLLRARLRRIQPTAEERQFHEELVWLCGMLDWCARLGLVRFRAGMDVAITGLPRRTRETLARGLSQLIQQRKPLWFGRHRPGGWHQTQATMERILGFLG